MKTTLKTPDVGPFQRIAACLLLAVPLTSAQAKLNVVVTTPDLASIARVVGGDKIEITTLARPTEDPHFVDAKPSFIRNLNRADALVHGGAELEIGWLPPLLNSARNGKILPGQPGHIACSQGVAMIEVPAVLDRSQGDVHALGNPHFVVDPENAKIIAKNVASAFGRIDEPNAETYRANAGRFVAQLDAKLIEWQKKLEPVKGSRIVSYHNSWLYFGRRFGLVMDTFLEPKPGIPPSAAHLASVIAKMKEQNVRVIFVDPYLSRRTAETVARNTGATVVEVAQFPGGVKGTGDGYVALLDYLVNETVEALEKSE